MAEQFDDTDPGVIMDMIDGLDLDVEPAKLDLTPVELSREAKEFLARFIYQQRIARFMAG